MKIFLPLSWIYGGVMAFRNWLFDHGHLTQEKIDLPVISVGNIAVGGTGKTPHSEYLLRLLTKQGYKCAMLSRGYGRKSKGYQTARGSQPYQVGDEPWQVQKKFPNVDVCVCEKRVTGIHRLRETIHPEVIILDDAYQHRYVKPGLSILLTDFSRPYYHDQVMPAGRLREFKNGAKRADIILVTKCPKGISGILQQEMTAFLQPRPWQTVYFTYFDYGKLYPFEQREHAEDQPYEDLSSSRILLLCGIAQPKSLINYLQPHCQTLKLAAFPDHHNFSDEEIEKLGQEAKAYDWVVTTEKDAARLSSYQLPETLKKRLLVQPVEVRFINNQAEKFNQTILNYVTENTRNSKLD